MAIETYSLRIGGLLFGSWVENVLHFRGDDGGTDTPRVMAKALTAHFNTTLLSKWLLCLPPQYGLQWIEAQKIMDGGGVSWWKEYPEGTENGAASGDVEGLGTSPIIKLFCAMGVNVQGRIFMPGVSNTNLVNNVYSGTYVTNTTSLANALILPTTSRNWQLAVYSPKNAASYNVIAATLSGIIGNQGRRRFPR